MIRERCGEGKTGDRQRTREAEKGKDLGRGRKALCDNC